MGLTWWMVSQNLGWVWGAARSQGPSSQWFSQSIKSESQAGTLKSGHVRTPVFKRSGHFETPTDKVVQVAICLDGWMGRNQGARYSQKKEHKKGKVRGLGFCTRSHFSVTDLHMLFLLKQRNSSLGSLLGALSTDQQMWDIHWVGKCLPEHAKHSFVPSLRKVVSDD